MTKLLEELKVNIDVEFLEGEFPELVNKIKAAGIREIGMNVEGYWSENHGTVIHYADDIDNYANTLEGSA